VGSLATHMKEHQWEGVRFLWKCIVIDHAVSNVHICLQYTFYSGSVSL